MRPDTDQASGIGNHSGLFLADQSWAHHLGHSRVASQLRIKAGMRDDDGPCGDLECHLRGLHIGMGQIDKDAQPITFFDDGCPERSQSSISRRIGVDIPQRHGCITIVQ